MSNRTACPLCSATDLVRLVYREGVPVHQNLLMDSADEARAIRRGTLDIRFCGGCEFAFNAAFDLGLLNYGTAYDNDQKWSANFRAHIDTMAARVAGAIRSRGYATIAEIGCGDGSFIRELVSQLPGTRGYGFDPSYQGERSVLGGRLSFEKRYFGPDCLSFAVEAAVGRHVIEHVPDPALFLKEIRGALKGNGKSAIYIETPDLNWILANHVVWDFFYEHCSLFTPQSLSKALVKAGFDTPDIAPVFAGQYLWAEALTAGAHAAPAGEDKTTAALAVSYAAGEQVLVAAWRQRIEDLHRNGKVALWGAGAKGVTLANLIDPERQLVDCVVDINPRKQGRFVPGSGHPIVACGDLPKRGIKRVILMNPNYRTEIENMVRECAAGIELF